MCVYFYTCVDTYDNSGWGRVVNVWSFSLIRVPAALRGRSVNNCSHQIQFLPQCSPCILHTPLGVQFVFKHCKEDHTRPEQGMAAIVEWRVDVPPPFLMEIGRRQRERAAASASIGSHSSPSPSPPRPPPSRWSGWRWRRRRSNFCWEYYRVRERLLDWKQPCDHRPETLEWCSWLMEAHHSMGPQLRHHHSRVSGGRKSLWW